MFGKRSLRQGKAKAKSKGKDHPQSPPVICTTPAKARSIVRVSEPRSIVRVIKIYFFFNDTATTDIYTLSLHDVLPLSNKCLLRLPIYTFICSLLLYKFPNWCVPETGHRSIEYHECLGKED